MIVPTVASTTGFSSNGSLALDEMAPARSASQAFPMPKVNEVSGWRNQGRRRHRHRVPVTNESELGDVTEEKVEANRSRANRRTKNREQRRKKYRNASPPVDQWLLPTPAGKNEVGDVSETMPHAVKNTSHIRPRRPNRVRNNRMHQRMQHSRALSE